MGDLAQIHGPRATRKLLGEESETADRFGSRRLRFSFGIDALGQRAEFFRFVQKIKAHCVSLLLASPLTGSKKPPPIGARPGRRLGAATLRTVAHSTTRTSTDKSATR